MVKKQQKTAAPKPAKGRRKDAASAKAAETPFAVRKSRAVFSVAARSTRPPRITVNGRPLAWISRYTSACSLSRSPSDSIVKKSRASSRVTSFQITGVRRSTIQSGFDFSQACSRGSSA